MRLLVINDHPALFEFLAHNMNSRGVQFLSVCRNQLQDGPAENICWSLQQLYEHQPNTVVHLIGPAAIASPDALSSSLAALEKAVRLSGFVRNFVTVLDLKNSEPEQADKILRESSFPCLRSVLWVPRDSTNLRENLLRASEKVTDLLFPSDSPHFAPCLV
jgi:hypothetical protein